MKLLFLLLLVIVCEEAYAQNDAADTAPGQNKDSIPPVTGMHHCKRKGMHCDNDAACSDEGKCDCGDDLFGLSCEHNATSVMPSCDECKNEAACIMEEEGSYTCICTEAFFGDTCDYPRASLECNPDSMDVMLAPYNGEDFKGVIYVDDQASDDACFLEPYDDMPGSWSKRLMLDSCGNASSTIDDDGNTNRVFTLVMQYNAKFQNKRDQLFSFSCNVLKSGEDQEFDSEPLESDKDNRPLQRQTVNEKLKPVILSVVDEQDTVLTESPQIGDSVVLLYKLEGGDIYDSFKLNDVVVTNGLEGDKEESMIFIEDGCVHPEAGYMENDIVQDLSGDPTDSVRLTFTVFKFLHSSKLTFRNNVKMCKTGGDCSNATDCDEFERLGRRRRAVEYNPTDNEFYKEYNTTVYVYTPHAKHMHHQATYKSAAVVAATELTDCLTHPGFLVLIIVLLVILLVSLAAMALCCVRIMHHRNKNNDGSDIPNKS